MRKLLEGIFRRRATSTSALARDGTEALALVRAFDPQVVTLDVQMPGMDGLTCLSQIMLEAPRPVVMISSLTAEGAEATLEAIELGARRFHRQAQRNGLARNRAAAADLVEKVRAAAQARIRARCVWRERIRHQFRARRLNRAEPAPAAVAHGAGMSRPGGLVLIGTSTGGPVALDIVLPPTARRFPWPIMVAQHMPANFTAAFARRLDRQCRLQVVEVTGR